MRIPRVRRAGRRGITRPPAGGGGARPAGGRGVSRDPRFRGGDDTGGDGSSRAPTRPPPPSFPRKRESTTTQTLPSFPHAARPDAAARGRGRGATCGSPPAFAGVYGARWVVKGANAALPVIPAQAGIQERLARPGRPALDMPHHRTPRNASSQMRGGENTKGFTGRLPKSGGGRPLSAGRRCPA